MCISLSKPFWGDAPLLLRRQTNCVARFAHVVYGAVCVFAAKSKSSRNIIGISSAVDVNVRSSTEIPIIGLRRNAFFLLSAGLSAVTGSYFLGSIGSSISCLAMLYINLVQPNQPSQSSCLGPLLRYWLLSRSKVSSAAQWLEFQIFLF